MMFKFWNKNPDRFRLDAHREVLIDGEPHVITGFSADGHMQDHTFISVNFEPTQQYINRNRSRDISVAVDSALR